MKGERQGDGREGKGKGMDGCVGMQMGGEGGGFSDVQGLGWEGKSWGGGGGRFMI